MRQTCNNNSVYEWPPTTIFKILIFSISHLQACQGTNLLQKRTDLVGMGANASSERCLLFILLDIIIFIIDLTYKNPSPTLSKRGKALNFIQVKDTRKGNLLLCAGTYSA